MNYISDAFLGLSLAFSLFLSTMNNLDRHKPTLAERRALITILINPSTYTFTTGSTSLGAVPGQNQAAMCFEVRTRRVCVGCERNVQEWVATSRCVRFRVKKLLSKAHRDGRRGCGWRAEKVEPEVIPAVCLDCMLKESRRQLLGSPSPEQG